MRVARVPVDELVGTHAVGRTKRELEHAEQERTQNEVALALRHFGFLREVDRLRLADVPQLGVRQGSGEAELRHRHFIVATLQGGVETVTSSERFSSRPEKGRVGCRQ